MVVPFAGETAFFIFAWLNELLISIAETPSFRSCVEISASEIPCCCISITFSRVAMLCCCFCGFYF